MHEIAKVTTGEGATQAMAKRKLDALGNVRAHCGFANDEKRLKRLRQQMALADSLADISKQTQVIPSPAPTATTASTASTAPTTPTIPSALQPCPPTLLCAQCASRTHAPVGRQGK